MDALHVTPEAAIQELGELLEALSATVSVTLGQLGEADDIRTQARTFEPNVRWRFAVHREARAEALRKESNQAACVAAGCVMPRLIDHLETVGVYGNSEWEKRLTAKVSITALVIGTGFGGAVAACRLSQAGFAPLVLERGRRYEQADFPALPSEGGFLPDARRLAWGTDQGFVDVQDLDEVLSVQAAGYGGGSLIYANVHLRARPEIFEQALTPARDEDGRHESETREHDAPGEQREDEGGEQRVWPKAYTRRSLDPYYDLVASMLDVAPITEHADGARLVKADQLKRASRALGREAECFHPPIAVARKDGFNAHGRQQKACIQCGACCMGCPATAKNTLDYNYLAVAEASGATVKTQCEVIEISRHGESYRVTYVDHLRAEKVVVEAKYVFLCAGSVHSTRLLASAQLGASDEHENAPIGLGYFPNADAFGVVFDSKHPQYPSWGPTITTATVFRDRDIGDPNREASRSWFMLQDGGYASALERMIGLLRSPVLAGRNYYPKPANAADLGASEHEPPPAEALPRAPALRSPFDGVLDAYVGGSLASALPAQLEQALPQIRDAMSRWIFPILVEDTIDRGIRRRLAPLFRWFPPDSMVGRWAFAFFKRLARGLGSYEQIARDTQDALERIGGLPRDEVAARLVGYEAGSAEHRLMLLAMGPDMTSGVLHVTDGKVTADLDLYHLAPRYLDQELAMRDVAKALGGELRVNPAWSFLGKPVTVHSQGGCRMSETPKYGVTDPDGQVWHAPGLYVLDGASLSSSVGSNPSGTIAAVAERNVLRFIRRHKPNWPDGDASAGAELYRKHVTEAAKWADKARAAGWQLDPPEAPAKDYESVPLGIAFDETMQGFHADLVSTNQAVIAALDRRDDESFRRLETLARPKRQLKVTLTVRTENLQRFLEDLEHRMEIEGEVCVVLPGSPAPRSLPVQGSLKLFGERKEKRAVLENPSHAEVQRAIAGSYASREHRKMGSNSRRLERWMEYDLAFTDPDSGAAYRLIGYKRIKHDPGFDAWRDTTSLFVRLESDRGFRSAGVIHVDMPGFMDQMRSMRVIAGSDTKAAKVNPARVAWTLATFGTFFFGNLQRVYMPQATAALDTLFRPPQHGRER
ncbi:MAG TPA: GMC oxidoreductase [Polyangiaceae bacterium]